MFNLQIANPQNSLVFQSASRKSAKISGPHIEIRKSQIRKLTHLRNFRKSKKLCPQIFGFAELICGQPTS
jgi:hypothetical protein